MDIDQWKEKAKTLDSVIDEIIEDWEKDRNELRLKISQLEDEIHYLEI